ncbi:MAG: hexose kinase [Anaerolineae bacterium]|nr:hexose kinase [Anaerolineae bacterium]
MIVTLTPNPAVDHTVWVERLNPGVVQRYRHSLLNPAGKGINVSRMAHRLGARTVAFGFLAGETGLLVQKALQDEGVQCHFRGVPGQTRIDTVIVDEATGDETALYGPGPHVPREELAALHEELLPWLRAGRVLVLAGSVPPGLPQSTYAITIALANARGARTILNTGGEALRLGLRASPDLVKVTASEAEELLGRSLAGAPAVVAGARELTSRGAGVAVVTMGLQGVIAVEGERVWWATSPPGVRRTKVGAGDSLVVGLALALVRDEPLVEGLRLGMAAAAATTLSPGTELGSPEMVEALLPQVRVEEMTEVVPPAPPAAEEVAPPARVGPRARLEEIPGPQAAARLWEPPKRPVGPRERLRYGMDIDGTITQAPRHFKRLIDALLQAGDEVYIVTARPESDRPGTEALLASLGIEYHELLMRPDDWPRSIADYKVQAVQERELHFLMDDDPRNCWAVIQRTDALAGHMLPIPETPEAEEALLAPAWEREGA